MKAQTHIDLLGWLNVGYGGLSLFLSGLLVLFIVAGGGLALLTMPFAEASSPDSGATGIWSSIALIGVIAVALILGLLALVVPILRVVTGVALLKRRRWARLLGIIVAVLGLLSFPFGTFLGIYGLWVLLFNQESKAILASA